MAHLVESMFSVRKLPWHGLGEVIEEAPTSGEAIRLAGLNWKVNQKPVIVDGETTDFIANVRSDNKRVLGIVTDRYSVVQNNEAFAFTDALLGEGVRYETAGSLKSGKKIWLLARAPENRILGDKIAPYLCFMNTHDGSSALRILLTPIRIVCNNTLNLALNNAKRTWSAIHVGSLQDKIETARTTLQLTHNYMDSLNEKAHLLSEKNISDADLNDLINELFPVPDKISKRQKTNIVEMRNELRYRYQKAPDLKKHRGNAWGFMGAVSDFVTHVEPRRETETFKERRFERVVSGDKILDEALKLVA